MEINATSLEECTKQERERLNKRLNKNPYAENHEIIGLSDSEYRKTALWKKIREWIRARDEYTCRTCGRLGNTYESPLDVHHIDYSPKTMEGLDDIQLISLCRLCHDKIEWFEPEKRNKRECLKQKRKVLEQMLNEYSARLSNKREFESSKKEESNNIELSITKTTKFGCKNYSIDINYEGQHRLKTLHFFADLYRQLVKEIHINATFGSSESARQNFNKLLKQQTACIFNYNNTKRKAMTLSWYSDDQLIIKAHKDCPITVDLSVNDFWDKFDKENMLEPKIQRLLQF